MKKNYLFVIDRLENGGAERQLLNVAKYISNDVFVHITSLHTPSESMLVLIDECGFVYHNISSNSGRSLISRLVGMFGLMKSLGAVLKENNIDKCISFLEWSNVLSILVAKKYNIPVIINVRNYLSRQYGVRSKVVFTLAKYLIQLLYKRADKVICNSSGIKSDLIEVFSVPKDKISIIQNTYPISLIRSKGLETNVILENKNKNKDKIYFCACGRLSDQKRFESLVLSFQSYTLQSKRADVLIIIGDGPNESEILDLINQGSADIKLYSHKENPYSVISRADCFILHSDFEGFPNVLAEAVLLGKDCISVDCLTGPREILSGNLYTDYMTPIKSLLVMQFGLMYPYLQLGVESDQGLVNALLKYSVDNYQFDKKNHKFLCDSEGKKKWKKIL